MASIYEAVEQRSIGGVIRLLRAGYDPNWAPETALNSPLGLAAVKGYEAIAFALISHSRTILGGEAINGGLRTPPISLAAEKGYTNIVDALIQGGADVNEFDQRQFTPLHVASCFGTSSVRIIELLLDAGAEIDAVTSEGATPLMLAAYRGNFAILKYLLERGAGAQLRETRGLRLLDLTMNFDHPTNDAVLDLLLSVEPALDLEELVLVPFISAEQITFLMRAALLGRTNAVQILLRKGAEINTSNSSGLTALHLAFSSDGNYGIFKLLVDLGADVHSVDDEGHTHFLCLCNFALT